MSGFFCHKSVIKIVFWLGAYSDVAGLKCIRTENIMMELCLLDAQLCIICCCSSFWLESIYLTDLVWNSTKLKFLVVKCHEAVIILEVTKGHFIHWGSSFKKWTPYNKMATVGTNITTHEYSWAQWIHKSLNFPVRTNSCNS